MSRVAGELASQRRPKGTTFIGGSGVWHDTHRGKLTGRPLLKNPFQSERFVRSTLEFWCDWLEATIHLEVHRAFRHSQNQVPRVEDDLAAFG